MKLLLDIYDALYKKIDTVSELKNVEWYNQQDIAAAAKDRVQMFTTPCAYLEVGDLKMDTLSNGLQKGNIEFTVRLATESMKALRLALGEHIAISQKIYESLQNFNCTYTYLSGNINDNLQLINSVRRLSYKPDHNLTNIIITEQKFTAIVFDNSAKRKVEKVLVSPKIEIV